MSELKAGCLAIVIGCRTNTHNLGKMVTLERFVKKGEIGINGPVARDVWVVNGCDLLMLKDGEDSYGDSAVIESKNLLPIQPLADPLETTQKESEHVR